MKWPEVKTLIAWTAVVIGIVAATGTGVSAQGQRGQQAPAAPAEGPPAVSPAEIQRMFDAYALLQAQQQLQIRDEQFPQFLARFKGLQDIRRQALTGRMQIIQQLRRIVNAGGIPDEAAIKERLKMLQDLDAKLTADAAKAYDAIDQVLDVRQRAQFRIFEEVMERQKFELIARSRQANRPRPQQF
jgi:Spy/CpxP family protein refolding chaperone